MTAGAIHHRFDGPGEAPVVVLSHSLGADLSMWEPQMAALAARFRVLRYDARGHGGSAVPAGPYAVEGLASDVVELLDRLGIARAHFCGLSMGGMVGIWLGVHAPERLEKLVLSNTAARIGTVEAWEARIAAVRAGGMAAIADAVVGRWFRPSFLAAHPDEVRRARSKLLATSPDGYVATCEALRDADQREVISRVRAPTLVVAGSEDVPTPPAQGRFLAENIPGARYLELAAGHLSNVEAAQPFTEGLLEFLAGDEA